MITKEEQKVLELNDPEKSLWYCYRNKDANVKLHEDIIINNKDIISAYVFARDIPGADMERLQEVVINYGDAWNIYDFARNIEKSNKEELFKALLKSGNEKCINQFIEDIELSEKIKELVIFI